MSPLTDHLNRLDAMYPVADSEIRRELDPLTAALRRIDAEVENAEMSDYRIDPADLRRILDRITGEHR